MLFLLLMFVCTSFAKQYLSDMTISGRMAKLITSGIESEKIKLNSSLPVEVQYLLIKNNLAWQDLGGTLQRLILWEEGYVVTASDKLRQIKVRCDLEMDDVVVSADKFKELNNCLSTSCIDPVSSAIVMRGTICSDQQITQVAKCAVLVSKSEATAETVDIETSLIWAEEGRNSDVPLPIVRRHSLQTFAITMQHPTSSEGCPQQLNLVIPCTIVQISSNTSQWCTPRKTGVVTGLLQAAVQLHRAKTGDSRSSGVLIAICVVTTLIILVLSSIGFIFACRFFRRRTRLSIKWSNAQSRPEHYMISPDSDFFIYSNDATDSTFSDPSDREIPQEMKSFRDNSSDTGLSEVEYSDILSASKVLLQFQNDQAILALRVPIIDVNGDKVIARGSTHEVLAGTIESTKVILKRLRASKRNNTSSVERLACDIHIAATLHHPNIVRIVGIAWNSLQNLTGLWEYHSSDLERALQNGKVQHWTWTQQKLRIVLGILRGLSFLHSHSTPIIHGALESRHILLDSTGEPVLCGLGDWTKRMSMNFCDGKNEKKKIWISPEVLTECKFSDKSDIYSFGVIVVALDIGKPIVNVGSDELFGLLTPVCPVFIHEMAQNCLRKDPTARPTSKNLLQNLERYCREHELLEV